MPSPTVSSSLAGWLKVIERSKQAQTLKTYKTASNAFKRSIGGDIALTHLSDDHYGAFLSYLKRQQPSTEKLYATILTLYFEYLSAKGLHKVNMDAIRFMRRNETRKVHKRLRKIDMPALADIDAKIMQINPGKSVTIARAKALVVTLARTGLRAFEACKMKTTDLDKKKMLGKVIGKGNKEAYFIFDSDVLKAIDQYRRMHGRNTEWVFISHSDKHSKAPKHIDYLTAKRDLDTICALMLENDPEFKITAHQFRHYFVTQVYRETGDLKQAQDAARHTNIGTTEGYVHSEEENLMKIKRSKR